MNKSDKNNHMDVLKSCLDLYSANYRNLITIGHLNTETDQECIKRFSEMCFLANLIKESKSFLPKFLLSSIRAFKICDSFI